MAEQPIELAYPVDPRQYPISQRFGEHPENYTSTGGHTGVDFATPEGTPVLAAADGEVTEAGLHRRSEKEPDHGYGWYVRIQHGADWNTLYTQLRPEGVTVQPGATVRRGQQIGFSGNSGQRDDQPRLHFELRSGPSVSTAVDPLPILEASAANEGDEAYQANAPEESGISSVAPESSPPTSGADSVADQENPPTETELPPEQARKTGTSRRRTTPVPVPATPDLAVEFTKGSATLSVAQTDRPWALAIDCLAVPAGSPLGALNGGLASAWFREIGEAEGDSIRKQVAQLGNLDPGVVYSLELDVAQGGQALPFGGDRPRRLFIASAMSPDGLHQLANIPPITRSIVEQARAQEVKQLALPLLGTGRGGLDPVQVADAMLTVLLGEIELGAIERITIPVMDPQLVDAARQKFNLYRNNLAQAFSTDEAAQEDTLGIGSQVKALAETLMLREMPGGIAVGVLGSWGSGKTSVMRMIETYGRALLQSRHGKAWADDSGKEEVSPYVGHLYPIWFNAWTYAKGNLWASLMDTIFVTLDNALQADPARGAASANMWDILRSRKQADWVRLKDMEADLAQYTAESKDLGLAYQQQAQEELGKRGQTVAWNVFKSEIGQVAGGVVEGNINTILARQGVEKDAIAAANELRSLTAIAKHLQEIVKEQPGRVLAWLAVSLACIALPVVLSFAFRILNNALIWLIGWIPLLVPPLRIVTSWLKQIDQSLQAYRERSEQEHRRLQGLADEWVRKKLAAEEEGVRAIVNDGTKTPDEIEKELTVLARQKVVEATDEAGQVTQVNLRQPNNLAAYQALVKIQSAKVEEQRRKVGMVGRFTTLAEFVQSRLGSGFYENQLGPMRQVELDIAELSEGLLLDSRNHPPAEWASHKAQFPLGPARVILFIDDLDRCPPPRVVEMLEAIQLLLKTPLFVVVLGLDTRYATRALEKEYKEILQHDGDPSGLDYIEKIIQIPYRVRPIEQPGLGSFLRTQMKPQAPVQTGRAGNGPGADSSETTGQPERGAAGGTDGSQPTETPARGETPPAGGDAAGGAEGDAAAGGSPRAGEGTAGNGSPAGTQPIVTLPPAVVRFSQDDFEDVQACCRQVNLTPRSIKRLVNVMKLLEVFWFRTLGYERERPIKQSVIALLTLAAAYPEVMVEVFTRMTPYFQAANAGTLSLGQYLQELESGALPFSGPSRAVLNWQFDRLLEDVAALRKVQLEKQPPTDYFSVTFTRLTIETFNLVRSFSFIGDPAYTLEDAARLES